MNDTAKIEKATAMVNVTLDTFKNVSIQSKRYSRFANAWKKRDRSKKRPIHAKKFIELWKLNFIPYMAAVQMSLIASRPIPRFEKGSAVIGENSPEIIS